MTTKVSVIGALIVALALTPLMYADALHPADIQLTKLTFDQPVQIPNQVLPAGTYWFSVENGNAGATNIVRIYDVDRNDVVASLVTKNTERTKSRLGKIELTFAERSSGRPAALVDWYYPDRTDGHQFLYNRDEAQRMREENQTTLTVANNGMVKVSSLNGD